MAEKVAQAAGQWLIHFKGEGKGALTRFTETSFKKVLICHKLWLSLGGDQQEIATKSSSILKNILSTEEPSPMIQAFYYHRNCYANYSCLNRNHKQFLLSQSISFDQMGQNETDSKYKIKFIKLKKIFIKVSQLYIISKVTV